MTTTDSHLALLRAVPGLSAYRDGRLCELAPMFDHLTLSTGTALCREGVPAGQVFVIVEGEATVRLRGRSISRLGPGEFVGEMSLLDYGTRSATVIAETPMEVLAISPRDFTSLLNQPAVARRVASQLARRLRDAWTSMDPQPRTPTWQELTVGEARVARRAADGLTNKEIAAELHLSHHTIDTHLRRIYAKLQISSRVALANLVASWPDDV